MSEHFIVVREYIALRNFLSKGNAKANLQFDILFKIDEDRNLIAYGSSSSGGIILATVMSRYNYLILPNTGAEFETYSTALIKYVNKLLLQQEQATAYKSIIFYCVQFNKYLNLKEGYEPSS